MMALECNHLLVFISAQNVYLSHLQSYNAHEGFIAMIIVEC